MTLKRNLVIVGIVVLAVAAVIGVKLSARKPVVEPVSGVSDEIDAALTSGRPALFVFTYNGDCCEGTREFFDDYSSAVAALAGEFAERVAVVWLDTALTDPASVEAIQALAWAYEVQYLPSLLAVDGTGAKLTTQVGFPDAEALRAALELSLKGGG